ncbi:MAG: alpha/beta hydrolase [Alphaproteobacteria bacterium]|nr:alpha/beta hydrolase [Alphaproteobacteria bacterium]
MAKTTSSAANAPVAEATTYRGMPVEELERQYNPRIAVPDYADYLERHKATSAAVRNTLKPRLDIRYGEGPKSTLDIFRPTSAKSASGGLPIQLFFHGGYWRNLDKSDFSFVAVPLVAAGAMVVVVNYDLCPSVSLDEVVAQAYASIAWTARHAAEHGGDPARIFISGNSAGAHLVAMAAAREWRRDGLPSDLIKGAAAITGIFDIAPVLDISVNADIRLDAASAWRNSPMYRPPRAGLRLLVAVGANETAEWKRQSIDYAALARAAGAEVTFMEIPGANHFSISEPLADSAGTLSRAIIGQMGLA